MPAVTAVTELVEFASDMAYDFGKSRAWTRAILTVGSILHGDFIALGALRKEFPKEFEIQESATGCPKLVVFGKY